MANVSRKTIVLLALTLLLLAGLFFVFTGAGSRLERYYENKKAQAIVDKMEKPYREDIYGGGAPEETYQLFIDALKKGNIELAAKYFVVKRQADWLKELQFQKKENKLDEFIASLPKLEELKENQRSSNNTAEFSYIRYTNKQTINFQGKEFELPEGNYSNFVVFIRNTFTQKWKIENL